VKIVPSVLFATVVICATGSLAVSSWAQDGKYVSPGTGNTVMGHEARPDGTPNTGPVGPAESAVTPGQNAINGQAKKRDCTVPGQNASSASSPAHCLARYRSRNR